MTYNGIGLVTPRGSGTNGYVTRNLSAIRNHKDKINYKSEEELQKLDQLMAKGPNAEILDHERKRKVELKCIEMQELMVEQGYDAEDIETKVSMFRKMLTEKEGVNKSAIDKDELGRPIVKQTHQIAAANKEKNDKLRAAFGLSEYYVDGSSFDPDRRKKEEVAKNEAIAKAKYAIVRSESDESRSPSPHEEPKQKKKRHTRSESPSPDRKSKKQRSRKQRSESPVKHSKKKSSKRSKKRSRRHDSPDSDSHSDPSQSDRLKENQAPEISSRSPTPERRKKSHKKRSSGRHDSESPERNRKERPKKRSPKDRSRDGRCRRNDSTTDKPKESQAPEVRSVASRRSRSLSYSPARKRKSSTPRRRSPPPPRRHHKGSRSYSRSRSRSYSRSGSRSRSRSSSIRRRTGSPSHLERRRITRSSVKARDYSRSRSRSPGDHSRSPHRSSRSGRHNY